MPDYLSIINSLIEYAEENLQSDLSKDIYNTIDSLSQPINNNLDILV